MKLLADDRLYTDTDYALQYLRALPTSGPPRTPEPGRLHLYWRGRFGAKQAFSIKSFLATQDLQQSELWLWLHAQDGYPGYADAPALRPLLPFLQLRRFHPVDEARGTPFERRTGVYREERRADEANYFRHLVLYKYGGTYGDMDTLFLRDLRALFQAFAGEWCSRWSARRPYANSALLRLRARSEAATALLTACIERGSCRPKHVLRFEDLSGLDLSVLPYPFFDPLWPQVDRLLADKLGARPH
jgi:hypothetical protein